MDILRPQKILSNLFLRKSLFLEYITGRRLWEKLYTETQKTDMSGLLMSVVTIAEFIMAQRKWPLKVLRGRR